MRRRQFIAALSLSGIAAPFPARAQPAMLGLLDNPAVEQTFELQAAIDAAAVRTGRLDLPAGRYLTRSLTLPSGFILSGVPGATVLVHAGSDPLLLIEGADGVLVWGVSIEGSSAGGERWHGGLVHIEACENVTLRDCIVGNTQLNAITAINASVTIDNCTISDTDLTGIFVYDGRGVRISGNTISDCRNGGIRVWRGESGHDGAIVTANTISGIDWTEGGNGQNGNGINIFRADGVMVTGNAISDCAFSAIRLNATNDTIVSGNTCLRSGEVAIFSEFAFSGSVISGNIVDGASGGISMTNFDHGGRLAACTGNIVRNLPTGSRVNPDLVTPFGIAAEADAAVSGNIVEAVAGIGIVAGWGPYLRDVSIANNLIRDVETGIIVSVAPDAGAAAITGNTISGARRYAITANLWNEIASEDLAADASDYPLLTVSGNTIL